MEEKINQLYEIIKDYREDEGLMSLEIIENWITQFEEVDREFFLDETIHLMKQRYISKEKAITFLKQRIVFLTEENGYDNPQDFLKDLVFIDHQPNGKSQKVLLEIFFDLSEEEYNFDLRNNNNPDAKIHIYMDDILCTGDTLFKGLTGAGNQALGGYLYTKDKSGKTNLDIFDEKKAKLHLIYFCIHDKNIHKVFKRIEHKTGRSLTFVYSYIVSLLIDNNTKEGSSMNLVVPSFGIKDELVEECERQIKSKLSESEFYKEEEFFYRDDENPAEEKFYSSKENRFRYERILIKKCIEIYNTSDGLLNNRRPRPLGYGLNLDNSLGFGALIFTWRNVAFNTPLIFWYQRNGWQPLFQRNFIEYD